MEMHSRVAIVGDEIAGCNILHHLARSGWTEAIHLER